MSNEDKTPQGWHVASEGLQQGHRGLDQVLKHQRQVQASQQQLDHPIITPISALHCLHHTGFSTMNKFCVRPAPLFCVARPFGCGHRSGSKIVSAQ